MPEIGFGADVEARKRRLEAEQEEYERRVADEGDIVIRSGLSKRERRAGWKLAAIIWIIGYLTYHYSL